MEERKIKVDCYSCYRRLAVRILAPLLALVSLCGCTSDVVTITYQQVGTCTRYWTNRQAQSPDQPILQTPSDPSRHWIVFYIDSIDTTGSKSGFNFDPSKFILSDGTQVDLPLADSMGLNGWLRGSAYGIWKVKPGVVFAANMAAGLGYVVAEVAPNSTNDLTYFLNYKAGPNDPVVFGAQAKHPHNEPPGKIVDSCFLLQ